MVRRRQGDDGSDPVAGRAIPRPGEDRVWSDDWLSPNVVEGDEAESVAGAPGGYSLRKVFEPAQVENGPGDVDGPDGGGDEVKFGDIVISSIIDEPVDVDLEAAGIADVDSIILDGTPPVDGRANLMDEPPLLGESGIDLDP